ncbi:hypothetical protein ABID21_002361 [Pseudorhizobium tarimense]|uniref:Uncharacterized protein n=1 Tax=Pseudorhizobium tarimense TaxID=1079109 RepID=A0ABV2H6S9_9HYPH
MIKTAEAAPEAASWPRRVTGIKTASRRRIG